MTQSQEEMKGLMKPVWSWFLQALQQQGLSFVLLGLGVMYFYQKLEAVEAETRDCNRTINQAYQQMLQENQRIIQENTFTLRELKVVLSK